MAFYEFRQYKILPGKMDEWVTMMETEIIPFQTGKGMVITGSYRDEEDDTAYYWTRRFENEEERVALYAAVYESDFWKNEVSPRIPGLMDRSGIIVKRIIPTSRSGTK
ncbi:MAG: hypothetical protein ACJAU6_002383 [Alphaproteobacteria bacterium]|jgi:hypothetical protein